jgi:two-component system, OmpR family, sensor kinase
VKRRERLFPGNPRSRLQRTLFLWFGASMLLTAVFVVFTMSLFSGSAPWRKDADRARLFVGSRFDEVWDDPAARHKLAMGARRDLEIDLALLDASKHPIAVYGRRCPDKVSVTSPVLRDGEPVGYVVACSERGPRRPPPWRPLVGVAVAAFVLWAASSLLSFRLSRPFHELAGVAEDLGRGRFQARARLHEQKGEAAVLGSALNDMAARIEKQLADQRALLATVSHELRTPLARIRLLVELARSSTDDRSKEQKALADIEREVEEVDGLVGELLASSRVDFAALEEKQFDLVALTVEAMEKHDVDAALLDVEGASSLVVGDATLLGRAITNLLNNAQKHADAVEHVRVSERGPLVQVEVEDRGPGIPEGDDARIFEAFYRRPRSAEISSTGLGLALVQRIAEAHGGTAYARTRADGRGAIVGFSVRAAALTNSVPPSSVRSGFLGQSQRPGRAPRRSRRAHGRASRARSSLRG